MLQIGDNYKVESDNLNLILYKKITLEQEQTELLLALAEGEEPDELEEKEAVQEESGIKWKRLGYFGTIGGVLTYLVDHELMDGINTSSLEQIVANQKDLYFLIASLDFNLAPSISTKKQG